VRSPHRPTNSIPTTTAEITIQPDNLHSDDDSQAMTFPSWADYLAGHDGAEESSTGRSELA
jgi:hypothetical protein